MKHSTSFLVIILLTTCQLIMNAQEEKKDTTIYSVVDKYPVLITNEREYELDQINEFIEKYKRFPYDPNDCTGRVVISIIVEKNGEVKYIDCILKLCPDFDDSSMKVVKLMKKWKPGIKDGKIVRTKVNLTVKWIW